MPEPATIVVRRRGTGPTELTLSQFLDVALGSTPGMALCRGVNFWSAVPLSVIPIQRYGYASTITFDCNLSSWHTVQLTGNPTLALTNVQVGQQFTICLSQDAFGSHTVTWFSTIYWTPPTLTTTASETDIFTFKCFAPNAFVGFTAGQAFGVVP